MTKVIGVGMSKQGEIVKIRPEFRRNDNLKYELIENPDGGRVKIRALDTGLDYPPVEVSLLEWLEKIEEPKI
ncbi:MAG: hypothetical protein QY331_07525 [Melioribacteraceae bacterium]|nr:MAG: hypothetical protein QY331_07525 [Melioribacteraceae bacterium]